MSAELRSLLSEAKQRYNDLYDQRICLIAGENLSKLCNMRSEFDETFDSFFDDKNLRTKYNAWDADDNCPDYNFSNADMENMLDDADIKDFIDFVNTASGVIEDWISETASDEEGSNRN